MGGYGVANVNGGVRALLDLANAAVAKCNPLKDCQRFISGGARSVVGVTSKRVALAVACGCLASLNNVFG